MHTNLDTVIEAIGREHQEHIDGRGRHYMEVSIGEAAGKMGFADLKQKYKDALAVVPLKAPAPGMKVRIDGRTFINYAQFESGVAVPGYVARDAGLAHAAYTPHDSMVLNCA